MESAFICDGRAPPKCRPGVFGVADGFGVVRAPSDCCVAQGSLARRMYCEQLDSLLALRAGDEEIFIGSLFLL